MSDLIVHVEGLRELDAAMKSFVARLARVMLRRAVHKGANVFRDAMRAGVNRSHKTSAQGKSRPHLVDDIKTRLERSASFSTAIAHIGPSHKTAYIANFLEFGTAPHTIRARRAKMLYIPGVGFVKSIRHPGAQAHPFIRPAFDAKWRNAVEAVKASLQKSISRGK